MSRAASDVDDAGGGVRYFASVNWSAINNFFGNYCGVVDDDDDLHEVNRFIQDLLFKKRKKKKEANLHNLLHDLHAPVTQRRLIGTLHFIGMLN